MGACWDSSSASLVASCHQWQPNGANANLTDGVGTARSAEEEDIYERGCWQAPWAKASSEHMKAAMRASQGASQGAAFAKVLLRQVAWTALQADTNNAQNYVS